MERQRVIKRTANNEHEVYCWARAIINIGNGEVHAVFPSHNVFQIIAGIDSAVGPRQVDEAFERVKADGIHQGTYDG